MNSKQRRAERNRLQNAPRAEPTGGRAEAHEVVWEREAPRRWPTNPEFALMPPPRPEDYADYVEHPRFGKAPRFTGLDPDPDSPGVNLHWRTGYHTEAQHRDWERMIDDGTLGWPWPSSLREDVSRLVPGTAIEADLARQTYSPSRVTHYYDLDRTCYDCKRKFLFFAQEQKHWYEDLGFTLDSDAVRCPNCRKQLQDIRKRRQNIAQIRQRFDQLWGLSSRTVEETLETVDCCLTLIEAEAFSARQCERVRMLLKRVPEDRRSEETFTDMIARLYAVERRAKGPQDALPAARPVTLSGNATFDEEPKT